MLPPGIKGLRFIVAVTSCRKFMFSYNLILGPHWGHIWSLLVSKLQNVIFFQKFQLSLFKLNENLLERSNAQVFFLKLILDWKFINSCCFIFVLAFFINFRIVPKVLPFSFFVSYFLFFFAFLSSSFLLSFSHNQGFVRWSICDALRDLVLSV